MSKYYNSHKKEMASQVSSQVTQQLLKSDGLNILYGGMKPSKIDIYNNNPHSAKLSHNFPTLHSGLGNTMDPAGLKLGDTVIYTMFICGPLEQKKSMEGRFAK